MGKLDNMKLIKERRKGGIFPSRGYNTLSLTYGFCYRLMTSCVRFPTALHDMQAFSYVQDVENFSILDKWANQASSNLP